MEFTTNALTYATERKQWSSCEDPGRHAAELCQIIVM
jgi:hypothetical protein